MSLFWGDCRALQLSSHCGAGSDTRWERSRREGCDADIMRIFCIPFKLHDIFVSKCRVYLSQISRYIFTIEKCISHTMRKKPERILWAHEDIIIKVSQKRMNHWLKFLLPQLLIYQIKFEKRLPVTVLSRCVPKGKVFVQQLQEAAKKLKWGAV